MTDTTLPTNDTPAEIGDVTLVIFLLRLASEELREQYETWVREVDAPGARALPGIVSYRAVRVESTADGTATVIPYDYLELIEVSDLATYRESLTTLPGSFFDDLRSFIGSSDSAIASIVA